MPFARATEWNRGVRVASITLDADADVRLIMHCRLDVDLDIRRFPPDVVLRPEVVNADLQVTDFRVKRISHFDGQVARQLGNALKQLLNRKIDEQQPRLVARINQQVTKHEDDLRLSTHDAFREKWDAFARTSAAVPSNSQPRPTPSTNHRDAASRLGDD